MLSQRPRIILISTVVIIVVIMLAIARTHTPKLVQAVSYSCNANKIINVQYYERSKDKANGSVSIVLSDGREMELSQTVSASGIRYANEDESFVFWSKGNGALVLEDNKEISYVGCIEVAPDAVGQHLPQVYSSGAQGFSLRLPEGYVKDESYQYQALGKGREINGVKFTIPVSVATGTNLSNDSYVSVEQIPQATECSANLFTYLGLATSTVTEGDVTYSHATSEDAAAGNRYLEHVYALPGTNPCVAVRYFIHYGVFENYPEGSIKEFDKVALIREFDQIRSTLIVNQ